MAAYRWVYGFGHLRADCRGLGSAPETYARFEYGTTSRDQSGTAKRRFSDQIIFQIIFIEFWQP